jgi:hypothetical protein
MLLGFPTASSADYTFSQAAFDKYGESEPCVLDVHPDTMLNYKQGKFEPIIEDLRAAGLPEHLVDYVEKLLIARGVLKAFLVREELVNYKKVLKHFIHQYEEVEAELRRYAAVVYRDRYDGTDDEKFALTAMQRSIQLARGCSHILKCVARPAPPRPLTRLAVAMPVAMAVALRSC